jgi:hypothetical protein
MSETQFDQVGVGPEPVQDGIFGFVHHVSESKFFQKRRDVWGPADRDMVGLFLATKYKIKKEDIPSTVIEIMENAQVHLAANVAGYKSGVYNDETGKPYLILQSHNLIPPVKGDWPLIREITESMFGPIQTPYLYAWSQWGYLSYESRSLAPGQLLVLVGANNCGKTLYQEKIISPLFSSLSVKCQKYLMDKTEFNPELIGNCHWVLSDSISDLNYRQRKILTESIKEALVNTEQRLRGLYSNPCTVYMVPRISASINTNAIDALPIFEEGMKDKMMLFMVKKSSRLPDDKTSRKEFEAQIKRELPAYAYFLKHEFQIPKEIKEKQNIRFSVETYHHPEILDRIADVKRHVHLAEMLFKWQNLFQHSDSPLGMWAALTKFDAESKNAVLSIATIEKMFGYIMTELVEATKEGYCCGVKVKKPRRGHGSGRIYQVSFDPNSPRNNSLAHLLPNIHSNNSHRVIVNDADTENTTVGSRL